MPPEESPGCRSYVTKMSLVVFFLVYVLLGAYVFLLIETSTAASNRQADGVQHQHTPPIEEIRTAIDQEPPASDEMVQVQELVTRQALDKLWDITENLNILYKENWTRLAAEEITRLHSSLHQLARKDCLKRRAHEQPTTPAAPAADTVPVRQVTYIKWSYSAAFLYALSVITTLGKQTHAGYNSREYLLRSHAWLNTGFMGTVQKKTNSLFYLSRSLHKRIIHDS